MVNLTLLNYLSAYWKNKKTTPAELASYEQFMCNGASDDQFCIRLTAAAVSTFSKMYSRTLFLFLLG